MRRARVTARSLAVAFVLATTLLSCGLLSRPDPAAPAAVTIDGVELPLAEIEHYLSVSLPDLEGDIAPGTPIDEVRSRLLDALIDERLMLAEADRQGFDATPAEVLAYLRGSRDAEDAPDRDEEAARRHAEVQLKVQKLQETVLLSLPPLDMAEVERFLPAAVAEAGTDRIVRLRNVMLESPEEARKLHSRIAHGRMTFDDAVSLVRTEPSQGIPQTVAWSELTPQLQEALKGLRPGQVSKPVEVHGAVFLFQLESGDVRHESEAADRRSALRTAENVRRQRAIEDLVRDLRSRATVRIDLESLPFRYVPSATPSAGNATGG